MNEHSTIYTETQAISPLVAGIGNQNPYRSPEGFFAAAPLEIMEKIKAEAGLSADVKTELAGLSPLLAAADPITPYAVPQDYFPSLDQETLGGVKAVDFVQETLNHPSVLAHPNSRHMPYAVPPGYFETLPTILQSKLSTQPAPAPVVRLHWMRYAVAAALVGLIAMGTWLGWLAIQTPNTSTEMAQVQQQIQTVGDQELANFVQQQSPLIQTDLALLEENLSDSDIQSMLSEYGDEELLQFINGSTDENRIEEN